MYGLSRARSLYDTTCRANASSIFISGGGLQHDGARRGSEELRTIPLKSSRVISDKADAGGLDESCRGRHLHVALFVRKDYASKDSHTRRRSLKRCDWLSPDILCLAGYMRLSEREIHPNVTRAG